MHSHKLAALVEAIAGGLQWIERTVGRLKDWRRDNDAAIAIESLN